MGGGDFWTADNKKVEKTKSMKKSAPPPQGKDAIFFEKIKVFCTEIEQNRKWKVFWNERL